MAAETTNSLNCDHLYPIGPARTYSCPDSTGVGDLFSQLDRCYPNDRDWIKFDPSKELNGDSVLDTPAIVHWIWLGGDLTDSRLQATITASSEVAERCIKLLWTDQESAPELEAFCRERGIKLIHVHDVFGEGGVEFMNRDLFEAERVSFPPNYGAASDILRYRLIEAYGGVYLDADINLQGGTSSVEEAKEAFDKALDAGWNHCRVIKQEVSIAALAGLSPDDCPDEYTIVEYYPNDFIIGLPNDPLITRLNKMVRERCSLPFNTVEKKNKGSLRKDISRTVYRTGPDLFEAWVKEAITSGVPFEKYAGPLTFIDELAAWRPELHRMDASKASEDRLAKRMRFEMERDGGLNQKQLETFAMGAEGGMPFVQTVYKKVLESFGGGG